MPPSKVTSIKPKEGDTKAKSQDSARTKAKKASPSKGVAKKKKASNKDGLAAVSEDVAPAAYDCDDKPDVSGLAIAEGADVTMADGPAEEPQEELWPLADASEMVVKDSLTGTASAQQDPTVAAAQQNPAPQPVPDPMPPPPAAPAGHQGGSAPASWPPPPAGFVTNASWQPTELFVSYSEGRYARAPL